MAGELGPAGGAAEAAGCAAEAAGGAAEAAGASGTSLVLWARTRRLEVWPGSCTNAHITRENHARRSQ